MKYRIPFLLFSFLVVFFSCDNREVKKEISLKDRDVDINIALMPVLDNMPLFLAKERGLFDSLSLNVNLKLYPSQMDCDMAFMNNGVDVVSTDFVRSEWIKSKGKAFICFTSLPLNMELYANKSSRIKNVKQLRGKMVGISRYSLEDYVLSDLDKARSFKDEIFHIQVNDMNIRLKMMLGMEIDVAFLPEPYSTMVRMKGHTKLINTKDKYGDMGVIIFDKAMFSKNKGIEYLKEFTKAYKSACDTLNIRGLKSFPDIIKKYYSLDANVMDRLPQMKFKYSSVDDIKDVVLINNYLKKSSSNNE